MQARVLTVHIKPEQMNEATRLYREEVIPAAAQQPGLKLMVLCTDSSSGKGISVTVWEGDGMSNSESSGYLQQQLARFGPMFAQPPVREVMEVGLWEPARRDATHARVITSQLRPDKIDAALELYKREALPVLREQSGFGGVLLLVDRATGKSMSGTTWASEDDLRAGAAEGGSLQRLMPLFSDMFTSEPLVETYEISARHAPAS
jgi:hypothetical protein